MYEPEVQTVQLTIDNSDQELEFTNTYNGAYISLEKMIYNFTEGKYENVADSRYSDTADFNLSLIHICHGLPESTSVARRIFYQIR